MSSVKLHQFKVLTFDCYGTLINWEHGLINALRETSINGLRSDGELLALFSKIESPIETAHPDWLYPKILEETLTQVANQLGVNELTPEEITSFGASVKNWPPFPDSSEALKFLQQHYKLVILSNVDRESFSFSEAKLGVTFDMIITAQDVGSYKPTLENFNYALREIKEKWGFEKEDVLHTFQSLYHDAAPANVLGIHTAHIKRAKFAEGGTATPAPDSPIELDFEFPTLGEFAEAYKNEEH